jgi:hypothetical protein
MICSKSRDISYVVVLYHHLNIIFHHSRVDQFRDFQNNQQIQWDELVNNQVKTHEVLDAKALLFELLKEILTLLRRVPHLDSPISEENHIDNCEYNRHGEVCNQYTVKDLLETRLFELVLAHVHHHLGICARVNHQGNNAL